MGLFDFLFDNKKKKETSSFDEYCENCGELLEDCECDNRELSMEDIALMDMLDEDDEMEEDDFEDEEEDEDLSFDDFEALDEDDEW